MVHSSWLPYNGFRGKPSDALDALRSTVGSAGLLVLPSMPYHNMSTREYLDRGKTFDVRRTPSMMGILSESFRRSAGVERSLSPSHPLRAWGKGRDEFLSNHEGTDEPFGVKSPFARLLERNAWILGIDVPFSSFTFTHHVEVLTSSSLPFPLYDLEPRVVPVIDHSGTKREISVRVLAKAANAARREERLVDELNTAGALRMTRIGNTRLLLVRCSEVLGAAMRLVERGDHFFKLSLTACQGSERLGGVANEDVSRK